METDLLKRLVDEARLVAAKAYAPYSRFQVGAALLGSDGQIHSGCNVENASYGLTICAERNAIWAAVARGCRSFEQLVVFTDTQKPTPPCGACRQVLMEFAPQLIIHLANRAGIASTHQLGDLLPESFGPAHFLPQ